MSPLDDVGRSAPAKKCQTGPTRGNGDAGRNGTVCANGVCTDCCGFLAIQGRALGRCFKGCAALVCAKSHEKVMSSRAALHDSDSHRGLLIAPHDHPARKSLVSLVAPVYNESAVVGAFYERATQTLAALDNTDYEILGEYLGRIFKKVKPRPMYIVDQLIECDLDRNSGQV